MVLIDNNLIHFMNYISFGLFFGGLISIIGTKLLYKYYMYKYENKLLTAKQFLTICFIETQIIWVLMY